MEQGKNSKKLPGFYIALCGCVIAIGVAGFFAQGIENSRSTNALTEVEEESTPEVTEEAPAMVEITEEPTVAPEPTPDIEEAVIEEVPAEETGYEFDNPDIETASIVVRAENAQLFSNPLADMSIVYGFSGTTLMYNEVLGDWRTHNGVDIAADLGCSVNAAASGTVSRVGVTEFGNTVEIEHENGFKTVYAQLGDVNVAEGDIVEEGSVIGTVGESCGENTSDPHLHYEIHRDGKPENPEEY